MMINTPKNKSEEEALPESGNIWGWKFSMISLVFIMFIVLVMWYRHVSLGIPFIPSEIHTEESIKAKEMETQQQQ
ncbi:MAG: hypothetical protein AB8G15_22240 [Saprospiraceae bacterium]